MKLRHEDLIVRLDEERQVLQFLVLERVSLSTRIYRISLGDEHRLPESHLDPATRPTIEELSAAGALDLPGVDKRLVFDSDLAEEISADLEGMAILSPTELLLVNDNDFGVEGAATQPALPSESTQTE